MKKILVVEDDISIHSIIKELLERENYLVLSAYSGTEALLLLEHNTPDLILLDLMLPGLNGDEIIEKITNIPIIVLSAKISPEDKINCLLKGANDYITKPFDSKELLARITVQLREKNPSFNKLTFKELKLLDDNHTLYIKENKINLTKTEYAILKQLLLNKTQVLTKNQLLELISKETEDCSETSLKVHISNLRHKIKQYSNTIYIESVWGIGFKISD